VFVKKWQGKMIKKMIKIISELIRQEKKKINLLLYFLINRINSSSEIISGKNYAQL